ncbi:uncharacterized protein LOC124273751 isoform X2 [Haliotis rubra]|uniref:uncharacterized protein LOC124273751 isoform X2 n=1 Tax=Haliotis rubra TaxID=36100 RepID=UPI001EE5C45F|nr:uncharacterized protein LOC124273751 isoform X2 [Haliotis rubra]
MATAYAKYVILDMNANGKTKKGMAEKRKLRIEHVLRSEKPLVVCLQEFLWKGIHSRAWKKFDIPDHFKYEGHKEAGFIYDERKITCTSIDNQNWVRTMMSGNELSRLCVCRIQFKLVPNLEILCVSWHGRHRVCKQEKENSLDKLVNFLLKLNEKFRNVPLLLGGDFNIPASTVGRKLQSNGILILMTPEDSSIDMFIINSDITRKFSVSKVYTMEKNKAFDHLPLKICLTAVDDTSPEKQKQKGDQGPQRPPEEQTKDEGPQRPPEEQTGDAGPQRPPEEETGDEGPQGPREDQTGDEGPQRPPEAERRDEGQQGPRESKQKTKGQEGMKKAKGA